LKGVQGGFFFGKMPVEYVLSVYTNSENAIGVRRSKSANAFGQWAKVQDDDPHPFPVMLDDAGLGFREHPELWPMSVSPTGSAPATGNQPWIVVKTSRPAAEGELSDHLFAHHAERTIAVMTADDLRLNNLQISRELSWERSAQDLIWEALYNDAFAGLRQCAYVVVSFNAAGAFLYSRFAEGVPACSIVSDPKVIEGMWEQDHPGGMVGYLPQARAHWRLHGARQGIGTALRVFRGGRGGVGVARTHALDAGEGARGVALGPG
jgi:hypothetical protein